MSAYISMNRTVLRRRLIKGNIAIIKHTDDGETKIETPESGATFEIYLKSAGNYTASEEDERDIIVCDENGFGQTKDMTVIMELQKATKSGKLFSYLGGGTDEQQAE